MKCISRSDTIDKKKKQKKQTKQKKQKKKTVVGQKMHIAVVNNIAEVLRWSDLSLTVKLKDKGENLSVLKPMSGTVRSGELVAIMGAYPFLSPIDDNLGVLKSTA